MTILSVAYALAPVGPDAVGGAEQVLSAIDHALVARGHRSLVVACSGSAIAGEHLDTGVDPAAVVDDGQRRRAVAATRKAAAAALARGHVDLVHAHGLDCADTLPDGIPSRLITLHLPPDWYPSLPLRPSDRVHGVSAAQQRLIPDGPHRLPFIGNGVPVDRLAAHRHAKRAYALMLGRVCREKGQHLALAAAHAADMPLLIGGAAFPYPEHRRYFAEDVAPRLDSRRRFLGPLGFRRKRRLLSAARCLLVPSLAAETSSLVAMEAAACGTPVAALRAGALPEIVEHGVTGILVDDPAGLPDAIRRCASLNPETCRAAARRRFSLEGMTRAYLARFAEMADP